MYKLVLDSLTIHYSYYRGPFKKRMQSGVCSNLLAMGIDVGSVSTKAVLFKNKVIARCVIPTGWSPKQAGKEALQKLLDESGCSQNDLSLIIGTGYGRIALPFVDKSVTEITCHARGASYLVPGAEIVIDIGGQDSKVIQIGDKGQVLDFVMNDKCAAGTGRFLQVTAAALGLDVSELGPLSEGHDPLPLNSMCAVFAESEVIGLLAQGKPPGAIVAGLHLAIARRVATMAQKMGHAEKVVFTGGVAFNQGLRNSLSQILRTEVIVPDDCQFAGAIGAALIAWEQINSGQSMA